VSGNTFTIIARRALVVGPDSGRIAITGNNFANSFRGGSVKREDAATGIELENTTDITVSGNVFAGLAASAVQVTGTCHHLVIAGNTMSELFRGETKGPAVELGTTQDAVIGDNAVEPTK
jgi:hypothetical protein